jgi:hypothetical protein
MDSTAHNGDLASIKSYGVVAQSCEACHDSFRGRKINLPPIAHQQNKSPDQSGLFVWSG